MARGAAKNSHTQESRGSQTGPEQTLDQAPRQADAGCSLRVSHTRTGLWPHVLFQVGPWQEEQFS